MIVYLTFYKLCTIEEGLQRRKLIRKRLTKEKDQLQPRKKQLREVS